MTGPVSVRGGKVRTPAGDAPLVPVLLVGIGGYLAWFGAHYFKSDVKWPSDPVKSVLQGKGVPPPTKTPSQEEAAVLAFGQQSGVTEATNSIVNSVTGSTGGGGTATGNQRIGQMLATPYGWGSGQQWQDLVKLWNQESGWNNTAENPSSHAYGIPQALPYTKMPKAAWPPRAGGKADPTAQISWGLAYIRDRYGSASAAWAHEVSNNWY